MSTISLGVEDIFKKSVIEDLTSSGTLSTLDILCVLGGAFALGMLIYFIYRLTFGGVIFVKSFGTSLIMLSMVTAMVIMPIAVNGWLAIGMVGALSIVRFRTAVKDPLDTVFMFWAIAGGIALGARLYLAAAISSALISVFLLIWNLFKNKRNFPFMLVIRFDESCKKEVQAVLRKMPQGKLKSKMISQGMIEMTIEMNIHESDAGLIDAFSAIPGVHDASLISYKGEMAS
jgi:hypothetical protein